MRDGKGQRLAYKQVSLCLTSRVGPGGSHPQENAGRTIIDNDMK
jgi:hypothetical protein